jgi:glycosyltransferase involved in cell wall biosynthesis
MNPKVSIIVPIYNVSCYIERCADSIFNQTFEDIEFIFVNDCTLDDSIEKLNKSIAKFPKRFSQIKIIHNKSNKGLAETRRIGLEASSGNFISFVDSDDYVESLMIEELYLKAIDENADMVLSDMILEYKTKSVLVEDYLAPNKEEQFVGILTNNNQSHSFCDKLFKKELLTEHDSWAPSNLIYGEDWYALSQLFYHAKKIVKINRAFYHYTQNNPNSITKNITSYHFENVIQFWKYIDLFLIERNEFEKIKTKLDYQKVKSKLNLMFGTEESALREKYTYLYYEEESNSWHKLERGEKILIILLRNKSFFLASIFCKLLRIKNK